MKLLRRISFLLTAGRRDGELREELEVHREELRDRFELAGLSAADATLESRRCMGNVLLAREDARETWLGRFIGSLAQDARYTFRTFRRNPLFALLALVTLAFGIGAATAIFSIVYAIVLKPLPYAQPSKLVDIRTGTGSLLSLQQLEAVGQSHAFTSVAGARFEMSTIPGQDGPIQIPDYACTPNLFEMLGTRAQIGRTFGVRDADRRLAVLGHDWWMQFFGGNPLVVGQTITLDDTAYEIVGVMPADFKFPYARSANVWIPADAQARQHTERSGVWLTVARLRADTTIAPARAELSVISSRLAAADPAYAHRPLVVLTMIDAVLGGPVKNRLFVLLAAVGLVLLLACVNVASLLLTRSRARARELAVRAAIGAGRSRLVRQLLTEAVVLGVLAGAVGIVLARWTLVAIIGLVPTGIPRTDGIRIDAVVLACACVLSILSGAMAGLLPAWRVARRALHDELKNGQPVTAPAGTTRTGGAFVFAETLLAVVLLVGAALMIRSFDLLTRVRPGFDSAHTAAILLSGHPEPGAIRELVERARRLSGVRDVSGGDSLPFLGSTITSDLEVQGRPATPYDMSNTVNVQRLLPRYFRLFGITLVRGREFTDRDVNGGPLVAVINEAVVRKYFPNEDPFRVRVYGGDGWYQIIGIAQDIKWRSLADEAPPAIYFPTLQGSAWRARGVTLLLRMNPDAPFSLGQLKTDATNLLGPVAPVFDVRSIDEGIAASTQQSKFQAVLLGMFGALALTLAIVGIVGVTSYAVLQRTREIGVRLALGAQRSQMLRLVVGATARPVAAGLIVGLGTAVLATHVLGAFLFQITPTDAPTYAVTAVLFLIVALIAAAIPAYQATRVDPVITLRQE